MPRYDFIRVQRIVQSYHVEAPSLADAWETGHDDPDVTTLDVETVEIHPTLESENLGRLEEGLDHA